MNTDSTKAVLDKIVRDKLSSSIPDHYGQRMEESRFIRYIHSNQGLGNASGAGQRMMKIVQTQQDPLEPPRFVTNKKISRSPPSPPAPVMHSPPRKLTAKEQQKWQVPPSISNYKNPRGYIIPLDKHLAANGRGLQNHINDKFASFADSLYIADRKARESVELRAQLERKVAQKLKEEKEQNLLKLAAKAREERSGFRVEYSDSEEDAGFGDDSDEDVKQREQVRHEKEKERRREKNLSRAGVEKRSHLKRERERERERERDISEQVALGQANPKFNSNEVQFDQRLFNQTQGVSSGFGDDDDYAVYGKAWKSTSAAAQSIYRPSKSAGYSGKGFSGSDLANQRSGPVQFEKQTEEDPFGLDNFLSEVKKKKQ